MSLLPPLIRPDRSLRFVLFRGLDCAAVLAGLVISLSWTAPWDLERFWWLGGQALMAFVIASEMSQLYRSWRGARLGREIRCAWSAWAATVAILLIVAFLSGPEHALPRTTAAVWFLIVPLAMACHRLLVRKTVRQLQRRGWNTRSCAIVGVNPLAFQVARNLRESPELGLQLVGFYDDRADERRGTVPPELGQLIGNLDQLVAAAQQGQIETVYISLPMRAEGRIRRDLLDRLADSTASVYVVPDFFVFELLHARWTDIGGLPAVSIVENPLYGVDGLAKRMFDLLVASLLLVLLAVPMAGIAMLVKLSSPGPVFFRQKRYGLDGRSVSVWKFRSMRVCENGAHVAQAVPGDARVTRLGAFLRRTSLDELPQLFNVMAGTMSLVGPRPHATAHNELYRKLIPGYMLRHKVKPGITGLAQVNGWRGETDALEKMEKRIECDHQYIRQWSLWLDIQILFRTILVVLSQRNAY